MKDFSFSMVRHINGISVGIASCCFGNNVRKLYEKECIYTFWNVTPHGMIIMFWQSSSSLNIDCFHYSLRSPIKTPSVCLKLSPSPSLRPSASLCHNPSLCLSSCLIQYLSQTQRMLKFLSVPEANPVSESWRWIHLLIQVQSLGWTPSLPTLQTETSQWIVLCLPMLLWALSWRPFQPLMLLNTLILPRMVHPLPAYH